MTGIRMPAIIDSVKKPRIVADVVDTPYNPRNITLWVNLHPVAAY